MDRAATPEEAAKIAALEDAGCKVAPNPSEMASTLMAMMKK